MNFIEFIKRYKKEIFVIGIIYIFIYMFYFNNIISIDTEVYINNKDIFLTDWTSIKRWSLVLFVLVFRNIPFNILIYRILTALLFFISSLIFTYMFSKWLNNFDKKNLIFTNLLLLSSPILAEQFNFTLQSLFISFGLILFSASFILIEKFLNTDKKIYLIFSLLLTTFCFGLYQSFIMLFISISIFFVITHKESFDLKKLIILVISIFLVSFVLYYCINFIFSKIYVRNSTYLEQNFAWKKNGLLKSVLCVSYYVCSSMIGLSLFHSFAFFIFSILICIKLFRNKVNLFLIISLIVSPFLLTIATASNIVYRAQFSYIFVLIFLFLYALKLNKNKKIIYILVMLTILRQSIVTSVLFYSDYVRFEEDKKLATFVETIQKNNPNKIIVFKGAYHPDKVFHGETLGKSFFEWDSTNEMGVNNRAYGFLQTQGINVNYASKNDYEIAKQKNIIYSYPDKNCVNEDDNIIIINLN